MLRGVIRLPWTAPRTRPPAHPIAGLGRSCAFVLTALYLATPARADTPRALSGGIGPNDIPTPPQSRPLAGGEASPYALCTERIEVAERQGRLFAGPPSGPAPANHGSRCPTPTPTDLSQILAQLREARATFEAHKNELRESDRKELANDLAAAELALGRYLVLADLGGVRRRVTTPLYAVGATLTVDDATVVGVADDWLIPIIGLAILGTRFATQGPAPTETLDEAWKDLVSKLVRAGHKVRNRPVTKQTTSSPQQKTGSTQEPKRTVDVVPAPQKDGCPPCVTVSGRIVPVGTIAHRQLDTLPAGRIEHGIAGPHYNLYKANQAPKNAPQPCRCFWQSIGAVSPSALPPGAIPIEPFAY